MFARVALLFSKNCYINICDKTSYKCFLTFKMPYYAVANGRTTGIFETWGECEAQVKGFKGAKYKKFNTTQEALSFITGGNAGPVVSSSYNNKNTNNSRQNTSTAGRYSNFSSSNAVITTTTRNVNQEQKNRSKVRTKSCDDDGFDDLQDEILKQMDEMQELIGEIKNNTCGTNGVKKSIMIDPLPINPVVSTSSSLKRPCSSTTENETKKAKKANRIQTFTKGCRSHDFEVNDEGFVVVYTDGACSNNGYRIAKAGLGVFFGDRHPLNVSEPVSGRPTNNCGEIQAATKAIHLAHSVGISQLNIKTDSMFVINSMTKWIHGWKRKGWKLANGDPVKNEVDFKDLDEAQDLMTIKWEYVNAHKGIYGNEMADKLAKDGAARYEK